MMQYIVSGNINSSQEASFSLRQSKVSFGVLSNQDELPNPAELLLGAFAACCLKNVQRFSTLLGFTYTSAKIEVIGDRQEKPTKLVAIRYCIKIQSEDKELNTRLLHRNLQKFGTIYNTLKDTCEVSGELVIAM